MNFAEALNVKVGEIERPPLPPLGHYIWNVKKTEFAQSNDQRWDIVNFQCNAVDVGPAGDVDAQALQDFGGLKMINITKNFMFSKEATEEAKNSNARTLYSMKQFLMEHLKVADESMSLREGVDKAMNARFLAPIQYRTDKRTADLPEDQQVKFGEIGRTAPVPGPQEAAPPAGDASASAPARRRAAG